MRYRVNWRKHGQAHHLLTGETTSGEAIKLAYSLLVEARPSDVWIETEDGRQVADTADVIEEGPAYSAASFPLLERGALRSVNGGAGVGGVALSPS